MHKKRFWILIGIGVSLLFFFILLSNIINVGERLRNIHEYVEYGFYVLAAVLVYVLVINPVRVITLAPTFSIDALLDDDKKRFKIYKNAARVLLSNDNITEEDKANLTKAMNDKTELKNALTVVFDTTIKEEINKLIIKNSKVVLVSTALSQNGNLDMLSVVGVNLKMIKEIVQISGFRPTYPNLAKLSVNVLATSLIAEGIEDIEISELLPNKISEALTDLPFIKTISSSILGGIANGMLTCRVGVVTRKYLFNDNKLLSKSQIRKMAYIESIKMMPIIVKDGLVAFPKGISSIFSKPFKKKASKAEKSDLNKD